MVWLGQDFRCDTNEHIPCVLLCVLHYVVHRLGIKAQNGIELELVWDSLRTAKILLNHDHSLYIIRLHIKINDMLDDKRNDCFCKRLPAIH